MKNSAIEWCHHTFNPWSGCTKVSPGCAHCYAETLAKRAPKTLGGWGPGAPRRRTSDDYWRQPLRWDREAAAALRRLETCIAELFAGDEKRALADGYIKPARPRVFCASLADWLDDEVPLEWLAYLLDLIQRTPNLDWLLLTKRPQNWQSRLRAAVTEAALMRSVALMDMLHAWFAGSAPANVWVGTTVEDQTRADERIPHLLSIPARVRFLSCEPLLGPVDLRRAGALWSDMNGEIRREYQQPAQHVDWVICGGESGPKARPMHPDWARSLRDQCAAAGVPFFFKQWGEWLPDGQRGFTTSGAITWGLVHRSGQFRSVLSGGSRIAESDPTWRDGEEGVTRVGKKAAGRQLDGREHSQFPEVRHA